LDYNQHSPVMKRILTYSAGMLLGLTLLASQCKDAIDSLTPDVNTELAQDVTISSADSIAADEVIIYPNTNSDFRDNKSKLKYVTITQLNFNVIGGTIVADRTIENAEMLYKHPDSTTYHSLGSVTNLKLSQMTTPVKFPATVDALNKLGDLAFSSTKGIKFKYVFKSDAKGLNFQGHIAIKLTLKLS